MRDPPPSLTFAFVEDGGLQVFADRSAAISAFEGIDVESGTVDFYGLDGAYLEPKFSTPNDQGRVFGIAGWVRSGTYDLVPSTGTAHDSFALALQEAAHMEPNEFFSDLDQLRQSLRATGVQVDFKHSLGRGEA